MNYFRNKVLCIIISSLILLKFVMSFIIAIADFAPTNICVSFSALYGIGIFDAIAHTCVLYWELILIYFVICQYIIIPVFFAVLLMVNKKGAGIAFLILTIFSISEAFSFFLAFVMSGIFDVAYIVGVVFNMCITIMLGILWRSSEKYLQGVEVEQKN